MTKYREINTIGVLGCGVIGASWTALFLAKGYNVCACDPGPNAKELLYKLIEQFWPALEEEGLAENASLYNLSFDAKIDKAFIDCDFIQENGPERIDIKYSMIEEMEKAIDDDVIIASSSSGLTISDIQKQALHPERILLGHPFNPPHLIPLVEIAGGKKTTQKYLKHATEFYRQLGKTPVLLHKEMKGHIANRLQAALLREAVYLLQEGVASAADIDAAVSQGPGLRWALQGPFLTLQLAGGETGVRHALDHLGPALELWWHDLGNIEHFSEQDKDKIVKGLEEELKDRDMKKLLDERDEILLNLIRAKAKTKQLP